MVIDYGNCGQCGVAGRTEIVYLRRLLREMGVDVDAPTVLHVDNLGAVELSKHHKSCARSRHVERRYFKVRELVAHGEIDVRWIDTKENAADLLSKGTFDAAQYRGLRAKVMPSTACAGDDAVRGVDKAQRSRSAPPRTERRVSVGGVCDVAVLPPVSAAERERTRREMREALAAARAEVVALGGRHRAVATAMAEAETAVAPRDKYSAEAVGVP